MKKCAFVQVLSVDDQDWTNELRVDIPINDTKPGQPQQRPPRKDEPDVPPPSDDVDMNNGPDDDQDWWNDDPPGPPPGPPSGPQKFTGGLPPPNLNLRSWSGHTPSPKRERSPRRGKDNYRIGTPRDDKNGKQ